MGQGTLVSITFPRTRLLNLGPLPGATAPRRLAAGSN